MLGHAPMMGRYAPLNRMLASCSSGPIIVLVCASREYRHYSTGDDGVWVLVRHRRRRPQEAVSARELLLGILCRLPDSTVAIPRVQSFVLPTRHCLFRLGGVYAKIKEKTKKPLLLIDFKFVQK